MSNTSDDRDVDSELQLLLAIFSSYLRFHAEERTDYEDRQTAGVMKQAAAIWSEALGRIALAEPGTPEAHCLDEVKRLWNVHRKESVRLTINRLRHHLRITEGSVEFHETHPKNP